MASPVVSKWNHKQSGRSGCLARKNHRFRRSLHGITGTVSLPVILVGGRSVHARFRWRQRAGRPRTENRVKHGSARCSTLPIRSPSSMATVPAMSSYRAGGRIAARNCRCLPRRTMTTWTDPQTGLQVEWQVTRFADFPAVEWVLWFNNSGSADTAIIENVLAADLSLGDLWAASTVSFSIAPTAAITSQPTTGCGRWRWPPGTIETMGGEGGHSNLPGLSLFSHRHGRRGDGGGCRFVGPMEGRRALRKTKGSD